MSVILLIMIRRNSSMYCMVARNISDISRPKFRKLYLKCLNMPVARIYGVVTFYSFFTMTPKGKHPISICLGTACYVRGAEKVMEEFKKELGIQVGQCTKDNKFSLSSLRCVGACGLAPVVLVGDKTYGRVAPDDVKNIIKEYD
jgi:NADP-reducing hydrogenase subunit HndA